MKKSNKVEKIKKKIVKDFKETLDVFSVPVPCIICGREEKCPLSEMPPKKILGLEPSLQYICEICKKELLEGFVCIISEDHSKYIVISDDAFNDLFGKGDPDKDLPGIDIPKNRVMYVDKDIVDKIEEKFL